MWPRRPETVSRPGRKPTALCPVDGLSFAWVPSASARCHSREEESFLPVRPWSAVDPCLEHTPIAGKATVKRVRPTHLAAITRNSLRGKRSHMVAVFGVGVVDVAVCAGPDP